MDAQRLGTGAIVTPRTALSLGENINGPSLVRAPSWIARPLGRYYLYFAHHDGDRIRLATADALGGPWRVHEPGVLPLAESGFAGHIASPDVHVDEAERRVRLYYHGSHTKTAQGGAQWSRVAVSSDGLAFVPRSEHLGEPYLRVVRHREWYLGLAMPGIFYRSRDGLTGFERGPRCFDDNMRHSALLIEGDTLHVFFSRVGDSPERILKSEISLTRDWSDWRETPPVTILSPEHDYEGANAPRRPSVRGIAREPVCELRDPAIFVEDAERYLLYSVAGERGIALARLR